MLRNIFSPSSSGLPLKDVIDLANRHLEDARGADTSVKALFLCGNAKVMIKDAENIINKSVKGQTFNDDIATAYHKHGKLLEELGQHNKAQKSYSKAEKWGYLHWPYYMRASIRHHPLFKMESQLNPRIRYQQEALQ
ncbi:hypothetical protein BGX21_009684 [Mortierella sp. AD011]|nr:hypothetical protein BGX20_009544 [Mortierella sp. AD010]KAF9396047.1 hypothetical protein BGX21_009684 [Mortierella sp. AD011]